MNIIGFGFTKVLAERIKELRAGYSTNTGMEITNLEKEKLDLIKDSEVLKISFKFIVDYLFKPETESQKLLKEEKLAEVIFEGFIVFSANKEESKELQKTWKKKEVPSILKINIFNILLKKCSIKAAILEEDLLIPIHLPLPQLHPQKQ